MSTKTAARNQSMDLIKLIASFFVVCIHFWFPGRFGSFIEALARFAVPMFFIITGYFSYGISCSKIRNRTKHILKIYFIAVAFYLVWGCISTELNHGSTVAYLIDIFPSPDEVTCWLLLHIDPFSVHLWYLDALVAVYLIFWMYTRFWEDRKVNYRPFYIAGFCLFAIYFRFSILPTGMTGEDQRCLNAWFTGIPMFTIGLFFGEYQQRILDNFKPTTVKLFLMLIIGVALIAIQWISDMLTLLPFGALFILAGLMLLAITHPHISGKSGFLAAVFARCGTWSTWIYILHPLVRSVYKRLLRPGVFQLITEEKERAIHPLIVIALSLLAAMVIERLSRLSKKAV